ncbi:helix-turn-helix transcriptional regulator [Sphingobium baderi]|uniref:helix-turn-helix transcriptional regulator n=1 Tax=Sphingobium baderi TaxID=1332080 RepID=UPI00397790AE
MIEDKILRLKAVVDATGCPKSLIYRRMKDGTFPRSVRIGPRSVVGKRQRKAALTRPFRLSGVSAEPIFSRALPALPRSGGYRAWR